MHQKKQLLETLTVQLQELEKERDQALQQKEELLLQIQSQSDPAWVEMVLKRQLGVVAEGEEKVYFHRAEEK